jgi:hypothetical protein
MLTKPYVSREIQLILFFGNTTVGYFCVTEILEGLLCIKCMCYRGLGVIIV